MTKNEATLGQRDTVTAIASRPRTPTVSIIIPIHNAEIFIKNTLSALLKKAPNGTEIVLVFDNCSDKSYEVAKSFLEDKINFIFQFIQASNGSTALSRNQGIAAAHGEYVAFVDHDDIVDSAVYARMIDFVGHSKLDIVRFGYSIQSEDGTASYVEILADRKNYPFKGMFIWNGMFRRSFLNEHNIRFRPGYGEDYEFNLALLSHDATEGRIEKNSIYYNWRHHGDNLHKSRSAKDFIERIESILKNHGDFIQRDREVAGNLVKWVSEYIVYLSSGEHREGIANAYCESAPVYELMNGGNQMLIDSSNVRRLMRSKSAQDFLAQIQTLNGRNILAHSPTFEGTVKKYLRKAKRVPYRLRSVYINTGGFIPAAKFLFKKLCGEPVSRRLNFTQKERMLAREQRSLVTDHINFLQNHTGKKALFFVFRKEHISGGLISIYSIASKFRQNGIEIAMVGDAGFGTVSQNKLFPNSEITIPWKTFIKSGLRDFEYVMLPEVKVEEFLTLTISHGLSFPNTTLNILNQNNQLMPDITILDRLRPFFKDVTMTTAHVKYSTQSFADKWNVPLKHVSTYLSHRDFLFQPFEEKSDLVLFSVDYHPLKGRVIEAVIKQLPDFETRVIMGLKYQDYQNLSRRTKFSVTFGEGLDNYFIEPFFSGGIGVAVFTPDFMPDEFLEFENVFSSFPELIREIGPFMDRIQNDSAFRENVWSKNFEILSKLYDERVYDKKISDYIHGDRDFIPTKLS